MLMKCTNAANRMTRFKVGQVVSKIDVEKYYIFNGWHESSKGKKLYSKNGSEFSIHGSRGRVLYVFKPVKRKSPRKMLIRAFAKYGRRWNDSKDTPYTLLKCQGYRNSREWAKAMADVYFIGDTNEPDLSYDFWDFLEGRQEQYDFDSAVCEELSYW